MKPFEENRLEIEKAANELLEIVDGIRFGRATLEFKIHEGNIKISEIQRVDSRLRGQNWSDAEKEDDCA